MYTLYGGFLLTWLISLKDGVGVLSFVAIDDAMVEGEAFL